MISLKNATGKVVRETTAEFVFTDDAGETKTENIRVRYYDFTTKQLKEQSAALKAKSAEDDLYWNTESLVERIQSLPDIIGDDKKPVEITLEFLDSLELKNINSIKEAIETDLSPKK